MKSLLKFNEFMNENSIDNIINEEIELDLLFTEAVKRSDAQVMKDAEDSIKDQIKRYTDLMKTNPKKSTLYKAHLDLIRTKQAVLVMKKKLQLVKAKY
jgi:hypothetical protein